MLAFAVMSLLACSHAAGPAASTRANGANTAALRRTYVQALDARIRTRFEPRVAQLVRRDPEVCKYFAQERTVAVLLDIDRTGGIGEVRIVRSSGADALDKTVLEAIRDAFPVEPPPPSLINIDGRFDTPYRLAANAGAACAGTPSAR